MRKSVYNLVGLGLCVILKLAFCASNLSLYAQETPYLPPVVLPSPNAASLGQYGDHPVSTYTGIPDISIPLFKVKERGNELPIILSYHAGGVRAGDAGSSVGVNWTLMAGGAITRNINGLNDYGRRGNGGIGYLSDEPYQHIPRYNFNARPAYFAHDDPINTEAVSPTRALLIMEEQIAFGLYDTQPDNFFFNFNGYSGEFVYDRYGQIHLVKKTGNENFEIEEIDSDAAYLAPNFKIKTGLEDTYYFTAREVTTSERDISGSDPREIHITSAVTSWYLTKIEFRNGGTINLDYSEPSSANEFYDGHLSETYGKYLGGCGIGLPQEFNSFSRHHTRTKQIFLTHIYFAKGEVNLIYDGRQLNKIEIKDHNVQTVKSFLFNYENSNRRWLTSVVEEGNDGSTKPSHEFTYYKKDLLPIREEAKISTDHWGFYNGTGGLIPKNFKDYPYNTGDAFHKTIIDRLRYDELLVGGAVHNREPDPEKMKYGSLSKITYPTGGYTLFEFEPNEYSNFEPYWETDQDQVTTTYVGNVCAYTNHNGGSYNCSSGIQDQIADWFSVDELIVDLDIGPFTSNYDNLKLIVTRGSSYLNRDTIAILTRQNNGINIIPTSSGFIQITAVANTTGPVSGYVHASVTSKYYQRKYIKKKIGPGLRIKKITTHDGINANNDIIKSYSYSDPQDTTRTSGVLMSKPQYSYIDGRMRFINTDGIGNESHKWCTAMIVVSSSLIPLSVSAGGGYIGYTSVKESFGEHGHSGKKVYEFLNIPDEIINENGDLSFQPKISYQSGVLSIPSPVILGLPRENYVYKNGSLINSKLYEYDDS
ncbi:MAG: hypothetical protein AAF901_06120, partial [Bacteroidota bacterium]